VGIFSKKTARKEIQGGTTCNFSFEDTCKYYQYHGCLWFFLIQWINNCW